MAVTVYPPFNETLPQAVGLYTTVKNIASIIPSGGGNPTQYIQMFFGFLPPHGRNMLAGEEITIFGDLQAWISNSRPTPNERARRSLEAALTGIQQSGVAQYGNQSLVKWPSTNYPNGRIIGQCLAIINTPAPILKDTNTNQLFMMSATNGSFAAITPCWDVSVQYDQPVVTLPASGWSLGYSPTATTGQFGGTASGWSGVTIDAASLQKYFDLRYNPAGTGAQSLQNWIETEIYSPFISQNFFTGPRTSSAVINVYAPLPSNAVSATMSISPYVYPIGCQATVTLSGVYNNSTGYAQLTYNGNANAAGTYHFNITMVCTLNAASGGGTGQPASYQTFVQPFTLTVY
jgi:hypothetical protein